MFKRFEIDDMYLFVRLSKGYSRELDDNNVCTLFLSFGRRPRPTNLSRGGALNKRNAPQHDETKFAIYQI